MSGPSIAALLTLVIGVPLNGFVTWKLWRLSRDAPWSRVLRDRAIVATAVLVLVGVFGCIFLNNDQTPPFLSLDMTRWITRLVVLAVAIIPALYWLQRIYRRTP